MELMELMDRAKSQLIQVTGLKPVTITGAFKDDQGWHVTVDMLEMARIPPATDVLGDYEVLLDELGRMLGFERKRSHLRAEPGENGKRA